MISTHSPALPVAFDASPADIWVYRARVRTMRRLLVLFARPGLDADAPAYADDRLRAYVASLVAGIRTDVCGLRPGSWCVAADIRGMERAARDELVYAPTYLALAILSRFLERTRRGSGDAQLPSRFWEATDAGLQFATLRRLHGDGFAGPFVAQDAAEIFARGRLGYLLRNMRDWPGASAMIALMKQRCAGLRAQLERCEDRPVPRGLLDDMRPTYRETLWCLEDVLKEAGTTE